LRPGARCWADIVPLGNVAKPVVIEARDSGGGADGEVAIEVDVGAFNAVCGEFGNGGGTIGEDGERSDSGIEVGLHDVGDRTWQAWRDFDSEGAGAETNKG